MDAAVRRALAGVAAAARRLPRWAAVAIGIAAVAVVGEATFLIVQSGGEESDGAATVKRLPCNEREAALAVPSDRFASQVRAIGTVPPLAKVLDVYDVEVLDCVDLTDDGVNEMVLQLTESAADPETASGVAAPWAIYTSSDGRWAPTLVRTGTPGATVRVAGHEVRETSAALVEGDPLCCPSGRREGVVRWDGEEFTYRPLGGPRGRTIAVADGEAQALAGFPLRDEGLPGAIEAFGPPSTYGRLGKTCPAEWDDLGLMIEFANLGGLDPCGPDGRVGRLTILGPEAHDFGWQTQEGATVGVSERRLRKLYPDMTPGEAEDVFVPEAPEGDLFTLVGAPSEVDGVEGLTPVLSARVFDGRVVGFELEVGAVGE